MIGEGQCWLCLGFFDGGEEVFEIDGRSFCKTCYDLMLLGGEEL